MNPIELNEEKEVQETVKEKSPAPKATKAEAKVAAPKEVEAPIEVAPKVEAPVETVVEDLGDVQIVNKGSLSQKAIAIRAHLAALPKLTLFIPLQGGEKAGSFYEGGINGLRFVVPKGKQVTIPTQIAENIFDSLRVENSIGTGHPSNMRNVSDDVRAALS